MCGVCVRSALVEFAAFVYRTPLKSILTKTVQESQRDDHPTATGSPAPLRG